MTLEQKIKDFYKNSRMFQRELASGFQFGDEFLSKIESNQKTLKREYVLTLNRMFNYPFSDLNALWIETKPYGIVKDEQKKFNTWKVAE